MKFNFIHNFTRLLARNDRQFGNKTIDQPWSYANYQTPNSHAQLPIIKIRIPDFANVLTILFLIKIGKGYYIPDKVKIKCKQSLLR
ncbi:MAG: hypothetical protein ABFD61_03185 [Chloroherpetonaceae bacterium]|nr:hypothetical protein [Bacteroidota bacterium]